MEQELSEREAVLATKADLIALRSDLSAMEARMAHRFNTVLVAQTSMFASLLAVFVGLNYWMVDHLVRR